MSDLNTLTAADITRLLSTTRNRGGNERFLKDFIESGEMYRVVNEDTNYAGKTPKQLVSVKNALAMKAKELGFTSVKLVKTDDDNVIIVNTALLVDESDEDPALD